MSYLATQPYLRETDDGTYEIVVASSLGSEHVLPYCFHTKEDARLWLKTRKGKAQLSSVNLSAAAQFATAHLSKIERSLRTLSLETTPSSRPKG